jgi:inner membrane protein
VRFGIALCIAVATASHGILDAFTNGGLGVAFFAPFDKTRYFFPVTPMKLRR